MISVGIDPGKTGAVAVLLDRKVLYTVDCPIIGKEYDASGMAKIIKHVFKQSMGVARVGTDLIVEDLSIWIEKVHAMPKQGTVSMFGFGKGYGIWIGICAAIGVSYNLVAPQTWKKIFLKDMPKEKSSSILVAKRMFPSSEEWLTLKKHHNRAEAVLIAAYGRNHGQ